MQYWLEVFSIAGAWWLTGFLALAFYVGRLKKDYGAMFAWRTNPKNRKFEKMAMVISTALGAVSLISLFMLKPKMFFNLPLNLFKKY